jgi:gas vesicle protein
MDAEQGGVAPACPSEAIERDISETRARMDQRVGAIQDKLSVRHLADEFVDMLGGGAGAGSKRAIQGIRDNPIPAALAGAAVIWLLADRAASSRSPAPGRRAQNDWDHEGPHRVTDWMREKGEAASRAAHTAADAVRDRASHLGERLGDLGERASHSVREGAAVAGRYASSAAGTARHAASHAAHRVARTYEENPLVLAAAGLAVGLAAGLLIPPSSAENRIMGPASRTLKQRAKSVGQEAAQAGKRIATHVAQAAKEGSREGDELAGRMGTAIEAAAETMARETRQEIASITDVVKGTSDDGRQSRS